MQLYIPGEGAVGLDELLNGHFVMRLSELGKKIAHAMGGPLHECLRTQTDAAVAKGAHGYTVFFDEAAAAGTIRVTASSTALLVASVISVILLAYPLKKSKPFNQPALGAKPWVRGAI